MQLQDVVQKIFSVLPGRKRPRVPQLSREQALQARPIRNPNLAWTTDERGYVVVTLTRRQDLAGKALGWFFQVPESRPVHLDDELATFVWLHCDGQHTVADIAQMMATQHKVSRREIEASLIQYLQTLGKRGMVGFVVPREIAEQLDDEQKRLLGLAEIGSDEPDAQRPQQGPACPPDSTPGPE